MAAKVRTEGTRRPADMPHIGKTRLPALLPPKLVSECDSTLGHAAQANGGRVRRAALPGSARRQCPIESCDQLRDPAQPRAASQALSGDFGAVVVVSATRVLRPYVDQVLVTAAANRQAHQAFLEVVHLMKPPSALFEISILAPVLSQLVRRRWRRA